MDRDAVRSSALRVAALALLLLLALAGVLATRTLSRVPDATVYFVARHEGTSTLEAVPRRLGTRDPVAYASAAVRALADGPTPDEVVAGLATAVPRATVVRSAVWRDGVLRVDLDREVLAGGGTSSMLARWEQMRWTLTQPVHITVVEVSVDGVLLTVLGGEGLMIDNPWRRPAGARLPVW